MNLLLITDEEKQHYVLFKRFNSLSVIIRNIMEPKSFCMHCLQAFSTKEVWAKHKENCLSINGKQGIQMPKKGSKVQFQDHHRQMPAPFVVYADFEAITEKVPCCQPSTEKSFT